MVEPSFQRVNRLFVLAFENDTQKTSHFGYYHPNVEIKNYNVMINGENFFDQPIKNKVTYEIIRKIATDQGDDYTTGLSDCNWTRTHNHLVHKQTLNHLAKMAKLAKLAI